jgi:hypothetical protein
MNNYIKVESDTSLVRDSNSNAIINQNKSEYEKFMRLSETKYREKIEMKTLKNDVESLKGDLAEIKSLLLSIVNK